jgi:PAS domain S-box-containing protein
MQERIEETALNITALPDGVAGLLSAIVDSSEDAIVSKTLDGIITSWNRAAERMFGYSAAEAVGRHITLIIPTELLAEEDYVLGSIRSGKRLEHFETVRQRKDGSRLNVSLTVSPIRDSKGEIIGASKIARDITRHKRLELEREELLAREQEAREQLAQAVKARDEFIAVAAHELRNPLNIFLLNLQLLNRIALKSAASPQIHDLIEKTREQLGRLISLVDTLLDVTRVQSGGFELYRENFDLCGLIREVAARFRNQTAAAPISLDLQPKIEGHWDQTRLDQAIMNLLSNAVRYGERKPIKVTAFIDGEQAVFKVCDQGIGIAPENLMRIFDRFERAAGRIGNEGLGLGLWITKQITEAHGGTIQAESEPGKGSEFTVRLPLHP